VPSIIIIKILKMAIESKGSLSCAVKKNPFILHPCSEVIERKVEKGQNLDDFFKGTFMEDINMS